MGGGIGLMKSESQPVLGLEHGSSQKHSMLSYTMRKDES